MILSTIQTVVSQLSRPMGFDYGNLFEVNLGIPEVMKGKDTVFVYIPPLELTDKPGENGLLHTKFPLYFFIMKRLDNPTVDYKSIDVEPTMNEMLELGREFVHSLEEQDIVEKGGPADGIKDRNFNREYGWLDEHIFGISCKCEVPIMEGKTGCVP